MSLELPKRTRRTAPRLALGALMGLSVLVLSGCSAEDEAQIRRLAMPIPATEEAPHIYDLWQWAWLAAMVVGVIVWGLIFYAIVRFRRRSPNEIPVQTRYNLPIEIFYTIAPVIMVIVFFFFTVKAQNASFRDHEDPDRVITVVGQQWSWTFNYNLAYDKDTEEYSAANGEEVVHEAGTTGERPTLYLVEGEKTQFNLVSPDVIHSFWVPSFLFKLDVVPGRVNTFGVTPNREGTFEGRCAELCGVYHARMLFDVKVVSEAEFDAHMAQLKERGNTGEALGGADVNIQAGLKSDEGSHE